jgi:hypothetical protein
MKGDLSGGNAWGFEVVGVPLRFQFTLGMPSIAVTIRSHASDAEVAGI